MAGVETISIVIAAASVVIGVTMGLVQLRNLNRTRQAEIRMQLYQRLTSEEFNRASAEVMWHQDYKDHDEWREKYGARANPEAWSKFITVLGHNQTVAELVKREIIDADWVYRFHAMGILLAWEKIEPVVKGWRRRFYPGYLEELEDLYEEMKKRHELATGRKYERFYEITLR